jgi:hypothetical protein
MSIISKWNKKADRLRLQQQGELVEDGPSDSAGESGSERFRCRVCGREDVDPGFCLECLAETMEPIPSDSGSA